MRKPVVGETLYLMWIGNKSYECGDRLVTKVGRKYFEVSGISAKFHIDTWKEKDQCTDSTFRIWESKQAYEEYKELIKLNNEIKSRINGNREPKITLDQAIRIKSILDECK